MGECACVATTQLIGRRKMEQPGNTTRSSRTQRKQSAAACQPVLPDSPQGLPETQPWPLACITAYIWILLHAPLRLQELMRELQALGLHTCPMYIAIAPEAYQVFTEVAKISGGTHCPYVQSKQPAMRNGKTLSRFLKVYTSPTDLVILRGIEFLSVLQWFGIPVPPLHEHPMWSWFCVCTDMPDWADVREAISEYCSQPDANEGAPAEENMSEDNANTPDGSDISMVTISDDDSVITISDEEPL